MSNFTPTVQVVLQIARQVNTSYEYLVQQSTKLGSSLTGAKAAQVKSASKTDWQKISTRLSLELRYCMELLTEQEWGDLEDHAWYRDGIEALEQFDAAVEQVGHG